MIASSLAARSRRRDTPAPDKPPATLAEHQRQDTWAFEPGDAIGDGRTVIRLLGGGDRFEAWLGWDDHLATTVVLKMLRPDQVSSRRARAAIAREAGLIRALAHPGIVRCFATRLDGEQPYIVLEFLEGPRLSTLIRKTGPLAVEQLVPLAIETCSALAYLHHERKLHLDVKPQNIIMGAPPRLIDLSIARDFDEVGSLTHPLGTAAYMAPEQCDVGQLATIDPATDVWGLGAMLYEAANGHRPFRGRQGHETHPQMAEDPEPFHPRVPALVRDIIAGCLAKDPGQRPSVVDVMERFDALVPAARELAQRRLRRRFR